MAAEGGRRRTMVASHQPAGGPMARRRCWAAAEQLRGSTPEGPRTEGAPSSRKHRDDAELVAGHPSASEGLADQLSTPGGAARSGRA